MTSKKLAQKSKPKKRGKGIVNRDAKIQEIIRLTAVTDKGFGKICADTGMDKETTWAIIHGDEELDNQYARAKGKQMEVMAEELGAIADEQPWMLTDPETGVSRIDPGFETWRKTKLDTRRWLMSKLAPKKYGERTEVEHSGGVALAAVSVDQLLQLQAARREAIEANRLAIEG